MLQNSLIANPIAASTTKKTVYFNKFLVKSSKFFKIWFRKKKI